MRIGEFEFNQCELAGAMGDFGTLLSLAAGYIAVCGLDPAGFLVMMVLVAWQLARRVVELRGERLVLALLTGALAVVTNMAVGAFVGVVVYHLWRWWYGRRS
jgi:hypothetical protein